MQENTFESYIKTLNQIYYLSIAIQNTSNMEEMFDIILGECMKITGANYGFVVLKHAQSDFLYIQNTKNIPQELIINKNFHINDGICGNTIKSGIPKIINNISLDPKYIPILSDVKSELSVPIKYKNQTVGAIILDHNHIDYFTEKHLEFIQMISTHASFSFSHFIEERYALKYKNILETLLHLQSLKNSKEIFQTLSSTLNALGCCILNKKGEILFRDGTMAEEIKLDSKIFENTNSFILSTKNENHIPCTRIMIPRSKKDMIFIADKYYYFTQNTPIDIIFADRVLEFLASKDPEMCYNDVTENNMIKWIEKKILEHSNDLYDNVIGEIEKKLIQQALDYNSHNKLKTAQFLGINRNTLRHKMELYHLE